MTIAQAMAMELEHEAGTTRRFLERLPAGQLGWKPHEKSLTAGQLAMHIATMLEQISGMAAVDRCPPPDFAAGFPQPSSLDEVLKTFDEGVGQALQTLGAFSDEQMMGNWNLVVNDAPVMTMPRVAFLRSVLLNHLYHHRGQFGVYLRLLGAEVPAAYGPSGDEVPPEFEAIMAATGAPA